MNLALSNKEKKVTTSWEKGVWRETQYLTVVQEILKTENKAEKLRKIF